MGFTILELLIAVAIFSIVAVSIYSSFNIGVHAWRKAQDSYQIRQQARHALETLSRDLRCAVNFTGIAFEGLSDSVSFVRAKDGIHKLTCSFEKASGSLYYVLVPYRQILSHGDATKEEAAGPVLASGLSDVKFQYAYKDADGILWKDEWRKEDDIVPMGVRISLFYPSGKEEQAVEFSETVFIPVGTIKDLSDEI